MKLSKRKVPGRRLKEPMIMYSNEVKICLIDVVHPTPSYIKCSEKVLTII